MGLQQQEHPSGGAPPPKGHQMEGGTRVLLHGVLAVNSLHPQQMEMAPDGTGSSKGSGEVQTPLKTNAQKLHTGSGQDTSSSVMAQPVVQTGSKATNKEAGAVHGVPRVAPNHSPEHLHHEGISTGYAPPMHPMYYVHPGPPWVAAPSAYLSDQGEVFNHPSAYQQHVAFGHLLHPQNHQQQQYYHSHHRHNTHHHEHQNHTLSFQLPPLPPQQEEQPTVGTPHCGCSPPTVLDGNNGQSGSSSVYGNGSSNESPSTTKNGSNGHNDNGVVVGTNGDSAGNSGSGSGVDNSTNVTNRFAGFNGIMPACTPEDRFAWREAALNKFRQKRKEQCFAKKVRYQSRKKLAEQRPRVRGQFVRQTVQDLIDEAA
jgi:pseudo-response regulator 7